MFSFTSQENLKCKVIVYMCVPFARGASIIAFFKTRSQSVSTDSGGLGAAPTSQKLGFPKEGNPDFWQMYGQLPCLPLYKTIKTSAANNKSNEASDAVPRRSLSWMMNAPPTDS